MDAGRRHRLPLGELRTYMGSMRIDCAPVRIASWPELEAYMDGSAGSVGRIMAPLLGVPARHHAGYGRLGQAFQLANFIRDVGEDRTLDRIYLPEEDRAAFGVGEADLARPRATPELRALLAMETRRARGAVRRGRARDRRRARVRAHGRPPRRRRLPARARPRGADRVRRPRPRARPCALWQLPGAAVGALRR